MSTPSLELRGVTKSFGALRALDSVSLELGPREVLVVLGPTGAGKTTLLRAISGLERVDSGSVHMSGVDVTAHSPSSRDVALVFQNFSLYPSWRVRRNLEFPLRARGRELDEAAIRERVESAAEMLRITHLLDRESRQLSGGEMQRVAIGRAIVRRPKLFLMDEPLSNLDAKLRESLRVELVELVRGLGTPMVYVTHDQAEALSMGDRIVVLSRGGVLQSGGARDVYLAPNSALVARQLGSPPINVLRARRVGGTWLASDGTPLCEARGATPDEADLGIRPEHVAATGGDRAATVEVVEDTGPTRVVLVRFAGAPLHVLAPRSFAIRPGDEIRPRIDASRVIVWPVS